MGWNGQVEQRDAGGGAGDSGEPVESAEAVSEIKRHLRGGGPHGKRQDGAEGREDGPAWEAVK